MDTDQFSRAADFGYRKHRTVCGIEKINRPFQKDMGSAVGSKLQLWDDLLFAVSTGNTHSCAWSTVTKRPGHDRLHRYCNTLYDRAQPDPVNPRRNIPDGLVLLRRQRRSTRRFRHADAAILGTTKIGL